VESKKFNTYFGIAAFLIGASAVSLAQSPVTQLPPASADLSRRSAAVAEADWLTDGGDPQRTAWQKNEHILNVSNVKGMKLLWKYKTDNEPREMHALFPPLIVGRVLTAAGPKQVAIVAGISDNIYAIDVATGGLLWKHHFDTTFSPPPGVSFGTLCPGGQLATPVIGPGKTPGSYIIYAAAWDGRLHQLDVATGKAVAPSELFMPPNGKPYGLNLWNNVVYTTSAQGCGGNPNYVYAFDLATRRTATFDPGSGGMWGRSGPSIGKDGTVYTGTGDGSYNPELRSYGTAIIGVKLDPKTGALKLKDYYGPPNAEYLLKRDIDLQVTGPVFEHAGREWLVQGSKECRTWLLDTSALGGEDHSTAEHRSELICNEDQDYQAAGIYGAMATYEDAKGTRWVLVPFWGPKHPKFKAPIEHGEVFNGAVAAFKMEKNPATGQFFLNPAWISRDMKHADPPVIANGIVFGFASGEDVVLRSPPMPFGIPPDNGGTPGRIARSTHAVVYALDGQTGQELWSSGDTITSWNHYSGISVANGRVYIGTYDGTVYCFGLPQ
jgi:outer membrane protein assembly factor BamB